MVVGQQYQLFQRMFNKAGCQQLGDSLAGRSILVDGDSVVSFTEGLVLSEAEFDLLDYESPLCRGFISVNVLHGHTEVRSRQEHMVEELSSKIIQYGYLKAEPIKVSLRNPSAASGRGFWCFGSVSLPAFSIMLVNSNLMYRIMLSAMAWEPRTTALRCTSVMGIIDAMR